MKKIIALFGSILLFTGLKAQKDSIVTKETTAAVKMPVANSLKTAPAVKQISPASSIEMKKSNTVAMKENVVLPVKGNIILTTDKPVKVNPVIKTIKE